MEEGERERGGEEDRHIQRENIHNCGLLVTKLEYDYVS